MRRFQVILLIPAMLSSGCLFTSGVRNSDVAALEARVASLNQRMDTLEAGQGSVAASSAAYGTSATTFAPEASQAAGQFPLRQGWWALFSWKGAGSKLARGLTNVVTGWVEIPKRVNETSSHSGAFSGFTWGLVRGLGYGFVRTAAGGYEAITFPFPAPADYQPVIQPPYVFSRGVDEPTAAVEAY